MKVEIKIGTLNCCLGLRNKKESVNQILIENGIDVLCLQEIDLEKGYPSEILSLPNYELEVEANSIKSRVGLYISKSIKYVRKLDLEGVNAHLIVVDIKAKKDIRLINIYRCFNPQEGISAKDKFLIQLELINIAMTQNTLIIGDFNLDYRRRFDVEYRLSGLFKSFDDILGDKNLIQKIEFTT